MATPGGDLWIWKMPDRERRIAERYVVSLDIGGRNPRADYSVITVLDRAPLLLGGVEEAVATYRFHLDQDLTVWRAVQVAEFYNHALFAPEANSLDRKGQEGDHSLTILDEIKEHYDNIFARNDPARIREGEPLRLGFMTTQASKTDLVNQYNKRLRDVLYIERDKRALDEIEWYEVRPDGSYGCRRGQARRYLYEPRNRPQSLTAYGLTARGKRKTAPHGIRRNRQDGGKYVDLCQQCHSGSYQIRNFIRCDSDQNPFYSIERRPDYFGIFLTV